MITGFDGAKMGEPMIIINAQGWSELFLHENKIRKIG